jgi:hypothetical protein
MSAYQIQGYQDRTTEFGFDAERTAETLKDARREAKYMLTEDYRLTSEASSKLTKVQIWKGEELLDEIFGKEG